MKCQQPGCAGTIVDGYCDTCGMAPADATSAAASPVTPAASASAASAVPDGTACTQPGCTGTIEDGYCDTCGMAAGAAAAASAAVFASALDESAAATGSFRLESAAIGSQRVGTGATHRTRTGSQRLRSARLGAGLTVIPAVPLVDASKVIMKNPEVAEDKRTCANCGGPVGRSQGGRPGRTEGFCPACGQEFSFTPKLQAGDLVAGQYEVAGCLAHGGLGWIYLARDKNVSDRWVVLKGLLNSGDKDALAAAIAEQRFLAQVEHPLIVEIYNFVTHDDAGYIVMEYVGGTSLKQVLKARMRAAGGKYDPLPVDQALAYILEILPAFQYLHDLGLIYCDFKPDNLIQVGDALKLIDLGGVRHVDDQESAIYGTVGYQAPEVAAVGPSVASDLYTIGRTLVVLCMEFKGYQSTYLSSLPDPETTPLFRDNDSLYCLISKCCALDPADRFQSADELRVQLLGVLREVVAKKRARHRAHLGGLPAVRDAGRDDSGTGLVAAARPARRRLRRPARVADQPGPRDSGEAARPAREGTRGDRRGAAVAGPGRARGEAARPRGCGGLPSAAGRPVGVAGAVDLGAGGPPEAGLDGRGGVVQRRLPPGARVSWPPSWLWRSRARTAVGPRSPRASTTPAPRPTRRTSPRRRSAWPGSEPRRATPTAPSRPSTWCHPPAVATASPASCVPRCCSAAPATT